MYRIHWLHQAGTTANDSRAATLPRSLWRYFAALALILIATWLPRGVALDRLVTPDETRWLTRSANFYQALVDGDFANTYQWDHPGVTTMWMGTLGFIWRYPTYVDDFPGQVNWWREEVGPFLQANGYEPLDLLVAGRVFMVLSNAVVLAAAFVGGVRLIGYWPALVGFLLIATDPFHIAHSRLLHVDGLLSSLIVLSLLAFMNYLYRGRRRLDLVVSAIAAGLAWLTKSPAFFLVPFVGLLILLELEVKWRRQRQWEWQDLKWAIHSFVGWGMVGLLVFVLVWPAMWVDPVYTIWRVLRATIGYAAEGHEAPLYFNGAIFEGDPGLHFYPITYLWRTTPSVLVGLGLASIVFIAPRASSIRSAHRRPVVVLALFSILFTIFMSLGAKKFDRYLLPVYLPLDLVAGVGCVAAVRWLLERWAYRRVQDTVLAMVMILLVLGSQAGNTVSSYPYYLSYYNPLLGGTTKAPAVMMVGWGEGLDQAAHYLNSRPNAENLQVATGAWRTTFSYFFKGAVRESTFELDASRVEEWTNSDYYIVYINQRQRERQPRALLDYLTTMTPVLIVRLQGLDYVYVYDIRGVPPPAYMSSRASYAAGELP